MRYYWLALGVLVVWRLTHLLQAEDGPWDIVVRLRRKVGDGFWGQLQDCFYCLSLWVALPFAFLLGQTLREQLLLWPALSAGAIFLERVVPRDAPFPSVPHIEHEEDEHGMLRTAETTAPPKSPKGPDPDPEPVGR